MQTHIAVNAERDRRVDASAHLQEAAIAAASKVMRQLVVIGIVAMTAAGCTTQALNRHTVSQAVSLADLRYREILNGFAAIANNEGVIPSFAMTGSGVVNITTTIGSDASTIWDHALLGFSKQTLMLFGKHTPEQQWTVDPVVSEPQLDGMRYAFLWMLIGPPPEGSPAMEVLRAPTIDDSRKSSATPYHLDVADQLARIQPGWLHVGRRLAAPANACYQARCGETCVWVQHDGLKALSEFTLVVLDIATLDPSSLVQKPGTATVKMSSNNKDGCQNDVKTTEKWAARKVGCRIEISARQVKDAPCLCIGSFGTSPEPAPTPGFYGNRVSTPAEDSMSPADAAPPAIQPDPRTL